MKPMLLILLSVTLLASLFVAGCSDDPSLPAFTRVYVTPQCGVAPLQIDGRAMATGGDETGDPTGGNNNLEIAWNFGDGNSGQTSLAYHTFDMPGEYTVQVTATDPDGNSTSTSLPVTVLADTLNISAFSNFPSGNLAVTDTVRFAFLAQACDIDPLVPSDYVKMAYHWTIEGQSSYGLNPIHSFSAPGDHDVFLAVTYPALAVTRHDTLSFTVSAP